MKDFYLSLITEETDELVQLQETKHFLETIVSNSPDIIYILDRNGNIKYINENYFFSYYIVFISNLYRCCHPS